MEACTHCGGPLEDWGAHGLVCPPCDTEQRAGGDREHFARGYREGERDAIAGMPRALVAEEGDEPPVVKSADSAYYHGYKAAVDGAALDEAGAWSAYVAKHAMRANPEHSRNPLHLKLAGSYSVGIGTEDDKAMQSNAAYDSGWDGPGNYGLTDGEIDRAAARIAGSEELFGRWQSAVDSGRMATAGEIIADACGAPVQNVDAPAMAEVAREIALLRSGKLTRNARGRARAPGPQHRAAGSVEVLGVLYRGIDAIPVRLGVTVAPGAPGLRFTHDIVSESQAREIRVRVQSALVRLDIRMDGVVSVAVPEAAQGASGAGALDLAIALGILVTQGKIPVASLAGVMALGQLSLDGTLSTVKAAAVAATGASAAGARLLIVPDGNEIEARFCGPVPVVSFGTLAQVVEFMQHPEVPREPPVDFAPCPAPDSPGPGLAAEAVDAARRGQGLLLVGPPGAGKTMGARYIRSVLPTLTHEEALELTLIYSAVGLITDQFVCARPFRAPHHTVSDAGLIGGGAQLRPGEVSLAHRGVLFLDELPEFRSSGIEALAVALREGVVRFRDGSLPAAPFVVMASANPCPCGYAGTSRGCRCSADVRRRYDDRLAEMAQQLRLQRVDVPSLTVDQMMKGPTMRANAKNDVIWEDNLLTWVSAGEDKIGDPRGLDMIPTAEGRVAAQDMLEERRSDSNNASPLDQEHSFLEVAMGNGWSNVAPQDIGALTDATIVSMDGFIGDDGHWYPHPDVERPVVYAHMNYAVEDPIEMWAEGKPVFWMADVLEMTTEQRAQAREELSSAMGEAYEANMRGGGKVIESRRWKNARTGATASPYGAVPWSGAPGDTKGDWALETVGWTIQWDDGTIGTGQMPARTREEAQSRLDRIMALRPGHKPNARKNIAAVIDAFQARRPYREATCSTDGNTLYSYGLPIASYNRGAVEVLDVAASPSRTTSGQIRAVKAAFPGARTVDSVMHESAYGVAGKHVPNARRGQFKAPSGLTDAEAFFYEHAGYSYPQGASAAEQKRARVEHARSLARAEAEAESRGWQVEWEHDFDADTSWMDTEARAELERGATEILSALLRDAAGAVLTSLGGIHVRATGRDPYARVVAAEMAQEALAADDSASRAMALNGVRHRRAQPNWRMMLDLPGVERRLGATHVAEILANENPAACASTRAAAWWDANDPGMFEAYKSLARMIEDGELDDLIAETRGTR